MLRVCQFQSSNGAEGAPIAWAAKQQPLATNEESSDDEDGPAPLGTLAAVKQSKRQRSAVASTAETAEADTGREEWMMTPGQHDFLKGIQSKCLKSRTFRNEKNRGQTIPSAPPEAINPDVLAEVQAIQAAYEESRGPSLLDAHLQNQAEAKQQQGKKEWKWNREKNLDDGRRVDKNALGLVLGGAKTELRNKFSSGR
jgi:hypothetical protein